MSFISTRYLIGCHLSQYNFNREDIILLTGLLDRFDMDIVKTFKRGYGWYDGAITVNNKRLTVDCYSPLSRSTESRLTSKRTVANSNNLINYGKYEG